MPWFVYIIKCRDNTLYTGIIQWDYIFVKKCLVELILSNAKDLQNSAMIWHVYIVCCRDNTLYTGITNNLQRRIRDHNSGNGCRYTKYRYPVKLIYSGEKLTKSEALKRESYIKGLTRANKLKIAE